MPKSTLWKHDMAAVGGLATSDIGYAKPLAETPPPSQVSLLLIARVAAIVT